MSEKEQTMELWWITTNFLNKGGKKVMGPFVSRDLALDVRYYREAVEKRHDYFVDSEKVTASTLPSLLASASGRA